MFDDDPANIFDGDPILGVFSYLDVALVSFYRRHLPEDDDHRIQLTRCCVSGAFQLDDSIFSVGKRLEAFDLYMPEDKADALARGYILHRLGEDPLKALTASYVPAWAILSLTSEDEWRNPNHPLNETVRELVQCAKKGDQIVYFSSMAARGWMLIRNLNRVKEKVIVHFSKVAPDDRWLAAKKQFDSLGGAKGLLEGDFKWPLPENYLTGGISFRTVHPPEPP